MAVSNPNNEDIELELDKVNTANKNLLKLNKDLNLQILKHSEKQKHYEAINL